MARADRAPEERVPDEAPLDQVYEALETSPNGLSAAEARSRLDRYGPNELEDETTSDLRRLLSYFWGPIPWMIEIAADLSLVVGHRRPGPPRRSPRRRNDHLRDRPNLFAGGDGRRDALPGDRPRQGQDRDRPRRTLA